MVHREKKEASKVDIIAWINDAVHMGLLGGLAEFSRSHRSICWSRPVPLTEARGYYIHGRSIDPGQTALATHADGRERLREEMKHDDRGCS